MIANISSTVQSPRQASATLHHPIQGRSRPTQDSRWADLARALEDLQEAGRHSLRVVDLDCGAGCLLIHAARHARALGFTAIEGRGIDGVPQLIGRARAAAARLHEPAIGLRFDVEDVRAALEQEAEFPADIILWRRTSALNADAMLPALRRCGRLILVDEGMCSISAERRG